MRLYPLLSVMKVSNVYVTYMALLLLILLSLHLTTLGHLSSLSIPLRPLWLILNWKLCLTWFTEYIIDLRNGSCSCYPIYFVVIRHIRLFDTGFSHLMLCLNSLLIIIALPVAWRWNFVALDNFNWGWGAKMSGDIVFRGGKHGLMLL